LRYVATWNAAFLQSHDLNEAMTAFLERRAPRYEGR
jgi:enoyl-CoA hydratase